MKLKKDECKKIDEKNLVFIRDFCMLSQLRIYIKENKEIQKRKKCWNIAQTIFNDRSYVLSIARFINGSKCSKNQHPDKYRKQNIRKNDWNFSIGTG
jgi:hypothetical protein